MKFKYFVFLLLALLLLLAIVSYLGYDAIYGTNVNRSEQEKFLFIESEDTYEDVVLKLQNQQLIKSKSEFDLVAKLMSYKSSVRSGRYKIRPYISYRSLIADLRSGRQDPVNLTINNVRTIAELSGKLAQNIKLDSLEVLNYLTTNSFYEKYGLSDEEKMSLFIPNTYQVYWDITPEGLVTRLASEQKKFWNSNRVTKAKNLGLKPSEVYTLASIVDKESLQKNEKPRIAGVYLNRLEKGILLQADPTVVFSVGDFGLRRVLNKHLEIDHPYNTYKYAGLPPGPIAMASISGIDSVLDREKHDFLYFCAKPESNGEHAFAKTLSGHNRNAAVYRNWLNQRGIR